MIKKDSFRTSRLKAQKVSNVFVLFWYDICFQIVNNSKRVLLHVGWTQFDWLIYYLITEESSQFHLPFGNNAFLKVVTKNVHKESL